MPRRETVLSELPGESANQRLLVVHVFDSCSVASSVELRQQTRAEGLGWYTQSSVRLSPEQLAGFRTVIGTVPSAAGVQRRSVDAAISNFRVIRSETA